MLVKGCEQLDARGTMMDLMENAPHEIDGMARAMPPIKYESSDEPPYKTLNKGWHRTLATVYSRESAGRFYQLFGSERTRCCYPRTEQASRYRGGIREQKPTTDGPRLNGAGHWTKAYIPRNFGEWKVRADISKFDVLFCDSIAFLSTRSKRKICYQLVADGCLEHLNALLNPGERPQLF
jgi:hypothetical protein